MPWSAGAVLTAAQLNTYAPQAWSTYTPTLTGTGTTQGNATMTGGYVQHGKTVDFWARAVRGTTTVNGSVLTLSLPVSARSAAEGWSAWNGEFMTAGGATYTPGIRRSTTNITLWVLSTNGVATAPSATSPFTWATGDVVYGAGTYEAA